jgi:hypothetical protein
MQVEITAQTLAAIGERLAAERSDICFQAAFDNRRNLRAGAAAARIQKLESAFRYLGIGWNALAISEQVKL